MVVAYLPGQLNPTVATLKRQPIVCAFGRRYSDGRHFLCWIRSDSNIDKLIALFLGFWFFSVFGFGSGKGFFCRCCESDIVGNFFSDMQFSLMWSCYTSIFSKYLQEYVFSIENCSNFLWKFGLLRKRKDFQRQFYAEFNNFGRQIERNAKRKVSIKKSPFAVAVMFALTSKSSKIQNLLIWLFKKINEKMRNTIPSIETPIFSMLPWIFRYPKKKKNEDHSYIIQIEILRIPIQF